MTQFTEPPSITTPAQRETTSTSAPTNTDEKVEISVSLDSDLLRQIKFLTDDPSKVIEVAVRQWLRGGARRDDDLTRNLERNPPVPIRGEWND
ncbi:MAG: type II toxin-antitoxin system CcdA family antitoxin [Cyanothece sp. SIO2G6]|nr:type II toxin-antitoxin system CcdA family antitoxin [Cyanothece sp. SIO2G6]